MNKLIVLLALSCLATTSTFAADTKVPLLKIKGSLYHAGNPEGHCGASISGLILDGDAVVGKGMYDDCADEISVDLKVPVSLEVVLSEPKFKQARLNEIIQNVSSSNTEYIFTIKDADNFGVVDGQTVYAGGTVIAIDPAPAK